ncbi:MAG: N-acetyl-gamma-glutamyl-phosphate reductase [Rhizobiales bacterium]|nr:N-acetyl-gamma-glutamyl-phosphate reductase [Hyphomicrobiales bacterium]
MANRKTIRIAVIGASGYTGADLVRRAARHPAIEIVALAAKSNAGRPLAEAFPHFAGLDLPDLVSVEDVDFSAVDAAFCGLPHATAHEIIAGLPARVKVVDMSADFRLKDPAVYEEWYGVAHPAPHLLADAVYGLTEHYREAIAATRLVACPGCYPTATLLALLPGLAAGVIAPDDLIIDAKSGVSGAGRSLKQNVLFCEAGEGLSPYGIAKHRHAPEIEQEIARVTGGDVRVNFTPHLVPMSRGELVTCHVRLAPGARAEDLRAALETSYRGEPFVHVLAKGVIPATQNVRGSNACHINVFADRIPGRAIVVATIDNLVKGSAGQAIQNFNLMFDLPETMGLEQIALFP